MRGATVSITTLARRTGVSSKTLRYWESRGLLPRALRTHTGYRLFPAEAEQYIRFIRRAKTIGLTLAQMRQVLGLARAGRCPCPQVMAWVDQRIAVLDRQVREWSGMLERLRRLRRSWRRCACRGRCADRWCSLIADLPELIVQGGGDHETLVAMGRRDARRAGA